MKALFLFLIISFIGCKEAPNLKKKEYQKENNPQILNFDQGFENNYIVIEPSPHLMIADTIVANLYGTISGNGITKIQLVSNYRHFETTMSNAKRSFRFDNIPSGNYKLKIYHSGKIIYNCIVYLGSGHIRTLSASIN